MNFSELHLPAALVRALAAEQITVPTPVQAGAVPVLLSGKDAYISAETGSGKTLAFLLPLFCAVDQSNPALQAVIFVPTHELALQIQQQVRSLAAHSGLAVRSQLLIGGVSIKRQIQNLKAKPHIVIGSPGRIRELITLKKLKVHTVACAVIDEADRLLCSESLRTLTTCLASLPGRRQLVFVSATQPPDATRQAAALAPELVNVSTGANQVSTTVTHWYMLSEEHMKIETLRSLLRCIRPVRALVFVHRNVRAEECAAILASHNFAVAAIHSGQDKFSRQDALDRFRSAEVSILVASDIMARGLDVSGISHVFNLDIPSQSGAYLHRVGRTGRAGMPGQAVSLLSHNECRLLKTYQRDLGITFSQGRLKDGTLRFDQSNAESGL